ncbi:ABC transporter permease [Cellulomonas marina]|uniref:Putative ABC transport system permease protein n=1 Tax=Cellulomonas marina TaxID=988821 RepID=A0A1I1A5P9_9CELL|nr:ABC transporter permease [Cellulomonas marina]GIG29582.1 ABC transporter permease [Cellulomonas marina]SFB33354.1 putative ABC transport system permease protein [Cellulomonas marina]
MPAPEVLRLAGTTALLLLVAVAAAIGARTGGVRDLVVAVVRGAAQLALVAAVIGWVFRHPGAVAPYLLVMVVVATATATRRIGHGRTLAPHVAAAVVSGAAVVVVVAVGTGEVPLDAPTLLPYAAQVIGGAMVAAALAGQRLRDDVRDRWDEVEGWLALGAQPGQAVAPLARRAAARALVPAVDQTRSAGLVTLPGAFVGLLLGGASPWQAAELQVLVLAGMLAAEAVSAAVLVRLAGPVLAAARPRPGAP